MAEGWLAGAAAGALAGLLALPASCDLPREPHGTRDAVAGGTLVAVLTAPTLTPAEDAALAALAASLGARVELVPGDLHAGLDALGAGDVHVLVGGIPATTPIVHEAALTNPIGRERRVMMLRRGENAFLLAANRAVGDANGAARQDPP